VTRRAMRRRRSASTPVFARRRRSPRDRPSRRLRTWEGFRLPCWSSRRRFT
jgi:hypothetical protein